ncbi:nitronate monooxygenase family protein [Paenalcaligenes hermetiae]|uniref:Nitronate monooxygenase family protein n=1 Tax=Paenalcaligenes hermetiae TaxID=1157987 RepID=A0ABP9LZD0_9BURK
MREQTTLPSVLQGLRLPVIAAPMFTVSYPELVIAQCQAGIAGAFPALNARRPELLDQWLTQIKQTLSEYQSQHPDKPVGPIAVNQIIHHSNQRLEEDVEICLRHEVPIFITSLRAPMPEMIQAVHAYGGIVLHDVINLRHALKAIEAGVDGLILVAAGAGGHAGTLSPFALIKEIRAHYDGPIALAGAISTGEAVLAAQILGADLAYMGTRFIASTEAQASADYKQSILQAGASDIIYTDKISGVHGNYLRQSLERAGLDLENLNQGPKGKIEYSKEQGAKAWKDIWGAGQGVAAIHHILPTAEIVNQLEAEYRAALDAVRRFA